MKYDIAIFDLDGTILDTLEDLKNSTNFALSKHGFQAHNLEEIRKFVGNGMQKLIERAVPKDCSAEEQKKVLEDFNAHYAVHCKETTKPYDGIIGTIKELKKIGIKCAVVSNKSDYAVQPLCKYYFNGIFDIAVGIKEGIRTKPNPDAVLAIIRQFGGHKERVVYVGDSEVDVQTAKNAEVDCISVLWGFRDKKTLISIGASNFAKDARELLAYFVN